MPYIAVLVESPAKCGKIEKFLELVISVWLHLAIYEVLIA